MPQKKITDKKDVRKITFPKISQLNLGVKLNKINTYLATIFLIVWIFIGIFLLFIIVQSFRQGLLSGLLSQRQSPAVEESQQPTEADLPGIGKVNIACTQAALSNEAIQKIVQSSNISGLTEEEKSKFEPCIVQKEEGAPSTSPTSTP